MEESHDIVKLDDKDREILFELDLNARMPLSELAERVGLSPQTAKYRIMQLEKHGVIKGYVTCFDLSKFGYMRYRVYIRYENIIPGSKDEKNIINYFKNHRNVIWFASISDKWDLSVTFAAKTIVEFNDMLKELYERFPGKLHNNVVSATIMDYLDPRAYLLDRKTWCKVQIAYGGEFAKTDFDDIDKKIIKLLGRNARLSSAEIGKKLKLNYKTIQARIKRMERQGVIRGYRTWIDVTKSGYLAYKVLVNFRKFTKHEELVATKFCRDDSNTIYLSTCVWPWDIEINIEAESEKKFFTVFRSFRALMGDLIQDYEVLTLRENHKLDYCPFAEEL